MKSPGLLKQKDPASESKLEQHNAAGVWAANICTVADARLVSGAQTFLSFSPLPLPLTFFLYTCLFVLFI